MEPQVRPFELNSFPKLIHHLQEYHADQISVRFTKSLLTVTKQTEVIAMLQYCQ